MAQASVIRAHYNIAERAYELNRLSRNMDVNAMVCNDRTEVQEVFERLYAYETVNSQLGIDNARMQGPTRLPAEAAMLKMNDNIAASMANAALDKCLDAAKEIALVVSYLAPNDFAFLEPIVGVRASFRFLCHCPS